MLLHNLVSKYKLQILKMGPRSAFIGYARFIYFAKGKMMHLFSEKEKRVFQRKNGTHFSLREKLGIG